MLKPVKWSSLAEKDFSNILDYLEIRWNKNVCLKFINKVDYCIKLIKENPKQFPFIYEDLKIKKCVITKQNTLYYRETSSRIEVLRIYDTRQNPNSLLL